MFTINKDPNILVNINTNQDVLNHLEKSIDNKTPFNFLRFGDGGLKYIHSILFHDSFQLDNILIKEGIPENQVGWLLNNWTKYANDADYIDSPEIYFTDKFWPRIKTSPSGSIKQISNKTNNILKMWKVLYDHCNFKNEKYINPELNYTICTRINNQKTLLDLMVNKKICIIGILPKVVKKFKNCDIEFVKIVPHYKNQYEKSFHKVLGIIEKKACDYDFWIVCAGELGRIYSGFIKQMGGRSVDMGFVLEYWETGLIPSRLKPFLLVNPENSLEFILTEEAKKFENWI